MPYDFWGKAGMDMRDAFSESYGIPPKAERAKSWEWLAERLARILRENRAVLYFFAAVVLVSLRAHPSGDDFYFAAALEEQGVSAFLGKRYASWTSRILIEGLLVFLAKRPVVWSLLNPLFFGLAGYSLTELLSLDRTREVSGCGLVLGGFFLLPSACYNGAGWIATSLNYLWPCALALWVLALGKKALCGEKVSRWEKALSIPALLTAANMELVCALLLAVLVLYLAADLRQGRRPGPYLVLLLSLTVLSAFFILSCPGNAARAASETLTWFPEFAELSLVRKLELGFSSTLFAFFFEPNLLFFVFSLLLFGAAYACTRETAVRLAASVPLSASVFLGFFGGENAGFFQELQRYRERLDWYGTGLVLENPETWTPDLFCLLLCGTILFTLCRIFEKRDALLLCYVLSAGFATRLAMSFSPTIWASGERTFWVMDLCVLYCMGALARRLTEAGDGRYREAVFLIVGGIELFGLVNFCLG